MGLTVDKFFGYYIIHPGSEELSGDDRCRAVIASLALLCFAGLVHLVCWFVLYDHKFRLLAPPNSKLVATIAQKTLQSTSTTPVETSASKPVTVPAVVAPPPPAKRSVPPLDPPKPSVPTPPPPTPVKSLNSKRATPAKSKPKLTSQPTVTHHPFQSVHFPVDTPKSSATLTPLPPIHNIRKIPPLLSKRATMSALLKPALNADLVASDQVLNGGSVEPSIDDAEMVDTDLLSIPLSIWINADVEPTSPHRRHMTDPSRTPCQTLINERIGAFEKAIQLSERLKRLHNPLSLKVSDLLASWHNSSLRYALMMDDELAHLKVSEFPIMEFDTFTKTLAPRILQLSQQKGDAVDRQQFTQETRKNYLLIDLPKVTAREINQFADKSDVPYYLLLLISLTELRQVDLSLFSDTQIAFLFASKKHVEALTAEQIHACLPKILFNQIENLSDRQALELDFSKISANQISQLLFYAFDTDIEENNTCGAARLVPQLSAEQIEQLGSYFNQSHWFYLSEEQFAEFQFSTLPLNETIVHGILDTSRGKESKAAKFIPQFDMDAIYALCKWFRDSHWQFLSISQVKEFDIRKINENQSTVVSTLFDTQGDTYSRAALLIPFLSPQQLYDLSPFFTEEQWRYVTVDQLKQIDFTQMKNLKKVVASLFNKYGLIRSRAARLIPALTSEQLDVVMPHFSDDHFASLSADQVKKLDYSNVLFTKEVIGAIFDTYGYMESRAAKLIPQLSMQSLYAISGRLSDRQWPYVSDDQVKKFDFTQVEVNVEMLQSLFSTVGELNSRAAHLIPMLTHKQLYQICHLFTEAQWTCFLPEQLLMFDFSQVKPDALKDVVTKLFDIQLGIRSRAAWLVPKLSSDQLSVLRPHLTKEMQQYLV